ncbi:MAG: hypothetical protein GH155_01150, partial [Spirochaeta sp.]|nr:hypothetical protein [Spirochaeta sp.]
MQVLQAGHIDPIDRPAICLHLFKINQSFGKGYIVGRNRKSSKHYWAECYIENIGWLPVDPL